jgi:iduronate 2-sulfatase
MKTLLTTALLLACGSICPAQAKDYHLYLLLGQSNMQGYGKVEELPKELQGQQDGVWIFNGRLEMDGYPPAGDGLWEQLRPGHGKNFSTDGIKNTPSDRFGPEITFGQRLKELYPERNIALVKYAKGGTSISPDASAASKFGCWIYDWDGGRSGGRGMNQFDHAVSTLKRARAVQDIDGDGEPDRLIPSAIIWMQGESDTGDPLIAASYLGNLTTLMERMREQFGNKNAPVIIGRIADWDVWRERAIIRAAQAEFVAQDEQAALVTSIDSYGRSDKHHYDSAGYIDLGREFADALASLYKPQ